MRLVNVLNIVANVAAAVAAVVVNEDARNNLLLIQRVQEDIIHRHLMHVLHRQS